jgi:tRNA-2-methylthio-N6-dimethylallyladenosine synthase
MARLPRLMRLLHVPPQSGSDRILGLMRRGYTVSRYLEMVAAARGRMPDVAIMADFICGFPSETEEDHQATLALMRQVNFQCSFIFRYSTRPGTPAADLPDDVPSDVKYRRVHELQALQLSQQQEANTGRLGQIVEVLVEGPSKNKPSNFQGRSLTNDNVVFPRAGIEGAIGSIVQVRITSATNLTLTGERVMSSGCFS